MEQYPSFLFFYFYTNCWIYCYFDILSSCPSRK